MIDLSNFLSSMSPENKCNDFSGVDKLSIIYDTPTYDLDDSAQQSLLENTLMLQRLEVARRTKDRLAQLKHFVSTNVNAIDYYVFNSNNLQSIDYYEYLSNFLLANTLLTGRQGTTFINAASGVQISEPFGIMPLPSFSPQFILPDYTPLPSYHSYPGGIEADFIGRFPIDDELERNVHTLDQSRIAELTLEFCLAVEHDEELKEWIEKKVRRRLSTFKRIIAEALHCCRSRYTFIPLIYIKHMYLDLKTSIKDGVKLIEQYFQTSFIFSNSKYFIDEKTNFRCS